MKTLKQKWTEALPVFASVFFMLAILFLFIWGMAKFANWLNTPDTLDPRTIEEVKTERYKDCLDYSNSKNVEYCKNYLN
jgi:Na+-transporting methylmalonyl-CoA/oxaloacetate decarboxylase gamma subunit